MPNTRDNLFACISQFAKPIEQLGRILESHMDWLTQLDASGRVVATGAQVPATGGVLILAGKNQEDIRSVLATDPLQIDGFAMYWVFEFKLNAAPYTGALMEHFFSPNF